MELLFVLFIIPYMTALAAFFFPKNYVKYYAIGSSFLPLLILLYGQSSWIGSNIQLPWLPFLSVDFHLNIDFLSLLFLYLTAIIVPVGIVAQPAPSSPNMFYGLILLLQGLLIGFFTARDLVLFTLLYEAMLLPLFFIINGWGGLQREGASLKFLVYMIAGSVFMIAAVLALYAANDSETFNLDSLMKVPAGIPHAKWLCAAFLLAFAVKTPLFPFHAWLPDAYCQAPTSGTILLSALLSKAGIYGILRIAIPLFPTVMTEWNPWLCCLAIAGVLYGGMAAWMQNDFKRLIAYSSFSHVNFVLVGLFLANETAREGAVLQAFNHGITIAALFLVAGWLEQRLGSTSCLSVGGLAHYFPHLCWLTIFFVLAAVALPGTNNFVGELLILYGLFVTSPWITAFLGLSIVLSVLYMLRWIQQVYFGASTKIASTYGDIRRTEFFIAIPLAALILWVGIYPKPFLKEMQPAVKKIEPVALLEEFS